MDAIIVTGLDETIAMLQQAPKIVIANGFLQALSAAGNVMADVLEVNTPIKAEDTGGILDKGELREAVMVAVELDSQFRGGTVNVGFSHQNNAESVALWVHEGHRIVNPKADGFYFDAKGRKKKGAVTGMTKPNPFMLKTFDESAEAAVDAFA